MRRPAFVCCSRRVRRLNILVLGISIGALALLASKGRSVLHYADSMLKLPSSSSTQPSRKETRSLGRTIAKGLLVVLALLTCMHSLDLVNLRSYMPVSGGEVDLSGISHYGQCPQAPLVVPQKNGELWQALGRTFDSAAFKKQAADWLGGAVRIPTEVFDQMGEVGVDPRWEVFGRFHDYLEDVFPRVHATLELTKINTYGLVYEWKGSDSSLLPVLMIAHQDVVPVNADTVDQWEYPPFSGEYDGERIWGRGSYDDKSGLISMMASIESLIEGGFQPARGIVLAFGFDEEVSGAQGAAHIAEHLLSTHGRDGFLLLVDEGGGFAELLGAVVAIVPVVEKGSMNVRVEVASPGGHSSMPPPHTSIGILAQLLVHIEDHPFEPHLSRESPVYWMAQCVGNYAPDVPHRLRELLEEAVHSDSALKEVEKELFKIPALRAFASTTQAITLTKGGVKANALPEQAWAVINHRIATDSSVAAVKTHDAALLEGLAHEFNLSYTAFGSEISGGPAYGTLTLSDASVSALEPAPVSPVDAPEFALFSGTIKATYNAQRGLTGDNIVVAPGLMPANTDSRHYWGMTRNIYRYMQQDAGNGNNLGNGAHTVNECIDAEVLVEMIRFFTTLVLNADEFDA